MSELVIETTGLRKEFRTRRGVRVAVQDLDLAVPAGGVHGFLGPNGSGKTTTIRMLLGLAARDAGHDAALRPAGARRMLPSVIDRVGAVVESPKFSPNFTGRQNLTLLARIHRRPGDPGRRGGRDGRLTGRDGDRYKSYSLGMKQRLAIAATLLKEPELLILDEPTNGLDPAGIREIRDTIRDLGDAGVTVLLSSHILAEVQQVCTSATIIGNGRMLASGRGGRPDRHQHGVPRRRARPGRRPTGADGGRVRRRLPGPTGCWSRPTARPTSPEALGAAGIWLTELTPVRADLETVFLELTADDTLGGGGGMMPADWRRADPAALAPGGCCCSSPRSSCPR